MTIQPFAARAGFVKQAEDGAYILTADAYRFIRDLIDKSGISNTSVLDYAVLSQFVGSAGYESENRARNEDILAATQAGTHAEIAKLSSIISESEYRNDDAGNARFAELSKRLDGIELAIAELADPTALLVETVKWGTYTPTLTNVTNVDASTAYKCQFVRLGRMVCVSGRIGVDATLTATATEVGISLPIASNFDSGIECGGTASCPTSADGGAMYADNTNNRARMVMQPVDVSNQDFYFTFMYQIV